MVTPDTLSVHNTMTLEQYLKETLSLRLKICVGNWQNAKPYLNLGLHDCTIGRLFLLSYTLKICYLYGNIDQVWTMLFVLKGQVVFRYLCGLLIGKCRMGVEAKSVKLA